MGRSAGFYEVMGFNADSSGQWLLLDFMGVGLRLWVIVGRNSLVMEAGHGGWCQ